MWKFRRTRNLKDHVTIFNIWNHFFISFSVNIQHQKWNDKYIYIYTSCSSFLKGKYFLLISKHVFNNIEPRISMSTLTFTVHSSGRNHNKYFMNGKMYAMYKEKNSTQLDIYSEIYEYIHPGFQTVFSTKNL